MKTAPLARAYGIAKLFGGEPRLVHISEVEPDGRKQKKAITQLAKDGYVKPPKPGDAVTVKPTSKAFDELEANTTRFHPPERGFVAWDALTPGEMKAIAERSEMFVFLHVQGMGGSYDLQGAQVISHAIAKEWILSNQEPPPLKGLRAHISVELLLHYEQRTKEANEKERRTLLRHNLAWGLLTVLGEDIVPLASIGEDELKSALHYGAGPFGQKRIVGDDPAKWRDEIEAAEQKMGDEIAALQKKQLTLTKVLNALDSYGSVKFLADFNKVVDKALAKEDGSAEGAAHLAALSGDDA